MQPFNKAVTSLLCTSPKMSPPLHSSTVLFMSMDPFSCLLSFLFSSPSSLAGIPRQMVCPGRCSPPALCAFLSKKGRTKGWIQSKQNLLEGDQWRSRGVCRTILSVTEGLDFLLERNQTGWFPKSQKGKTTPILKILPLYNLRCLTWPSDVPDQRV